MLPQVHILKNYSETGGYEYLLQQFKFNFELEAVEEHVATGSYLKQTLRQQ
ncbi:hypothetical protein GCM10009409_27710 [Shewanella saliphila]|uniref:Uncharacterized protein n=1 Tax=Shewanella saliphila TaxID=2282698 RepID=A0ABQ2Q900_9GAMM|nr:hypothetical protein GCM10009409_27710 [Shewanella saliphila]